MKRASIFISLLALICSAGYAQTASDQRVAPAPAWQPFEEAVAAAAAQDKMVLVDIYAVWCGWCQKLQDEVYTDPDILSYLDEHFEVTRLDIEATDDTVRYKDHTVSSSELAVGLGAQATPTTVFLDANGDYVTRLPGYVDAEGFMHVLRYLGTGAYRHQSYDDFVGQKE